MINAALQTIIRRAHAVGLLAISLCLAGVALSNGGIGGTGAPRPGHEGSGIGGTGAPIGASEGSGIGGTGIVGVITAFGSIWVNGVEVHFPAETRIKTPTGTISPAALSVGQFVLVSSDRSGNQAEARSIQLLPAVAGPISDISINADRVIIAGQQVTIPASISRPMLQRGDWVQVSGLPRADRSIVATAVTPYTAGSPILVYGVPYRDADAGQLRMQAMPVQLPAGNTMTPGTPILISGQMRDGVLVADNVRSSPINQLASTSHAIRIQGYVQETNDKRITIGELSIGIAAVTPTTALATDQLVIVEAQRNETGDFIASHIDTVHLSALDIRLPDASSDKHEQTTTEPEAKTPPEQHRAAEHETHSEGQRAEQHSPESDRPETATVRPADLEHPNIGAGDVEPPEVGLPEVETPEADTPEIEAPEVEAPEVEAPELEVPEVEAPELEIPETEAPEIEAMER